MVDLASKMDLLNSMEKAIIGACLIDSKAIYQASSILNKAEYFFDENASVAYGALLKMMENNMAIDMLTLSQYARDNELGLNPVWIVETTNMVSGSAHIIDHCKNVQKAWLSRSLEQLCVQASNDLTRGVDANSVKSRLLKGLIDASEGEGERVVKLGSALKDLMKKSQDMAERDGKLAGEPFTGSILMDRVFSGIEPGDVIMIGARPKVGKSSVANNILTYSAANDIPTYCASGEMPNIKTAARALAAASRVATRSIERGEFWKDGKDKMRDAVDQALTMLLEKPIYISDAPLSIASAISDINYYYQRHEVKRFLFDRVGLFDEVVNAHSNDAKMRDAVLSSLRRTANTLGISIVIYTQITKEAEKAEGKRPLGHHIYGGTGGPANCTKAALIYRPEAHEMDTFAAGPYAGTESKGLAEIYTVYNNSDALRSCKVIFDGPRQIFLDLPEQEEDFGAPVPIDTAESPLVVAQMPQVDNDYKDVGNDDLPF